MAFHHSGGEKGFEGEVVEIFRAPWTSNVILRLTKSVLAGFLALTRLSCCSRECLASSVSTRPTPILSTSYTRWDFVRTYFEWRWQAGRWEYLDGWVRDGAACWPRWLLSQRRGGASLLYIIHHKYIFWFNTRFMLNKCCILEGATWLLSAWPARHIFNHSWGAGRQVNLNGTSTGFGKFGRQMNL